MKNNEQKQKNQLTHKELLKVWSTKEDIRRHVGMLLLLGEVDEGVQLWIRFVLDVTRETIGDDVVKPIVRVHVGTRPGAFARQETTKKEGGKERNRNPHQIK